MGFTSPLIVTYFDYIQNQKSKQKDVAIAKYTKKPLNTREGNTFFSEKKTNLNA